MGAAAEAARPGTVKATGRMDRVAVFVPDVDAAAADFERLFGWQMTVFDVEGMGIRVALCEEGIELVQTPPGAAAQGSDPDRLAGVCIRVDDLDEAAQRMADAGYPLKYTVETPGGVRELSYADVHGLPVVLYAFDDDP